MKRLAFVLASGLALAFLSSACMLNPVDGQVVGATGAWITFNGYTAMPNQTVQVEAASASDPSTWLVVGSTKTSAISTWREENTPVYAWSLLRAIPAAAWTAGTTGQVARIHLRVVGGPNGTGDDMLGATFLPGPIACRAAHPDFQDFMRECQSPNSPDAYVYTRDYPAGIDLELATLRVTDGEVEVTARNRGRHGKVTGVACRAGDATGAVTVADAVVPGETKAYRVALTVAGPVTCVVTGVNADGSPEANTRNNEGSATM